MYRAKITAISGSKVLANGKWLTCIGNSPVKVGGHIWTDGRCIYGDDVKTEVPIVITPKSKTAFSIPIVIDVNNAINYYTFYNGNITYSGNKTQDGYMARDVIFVNNDKSSYIMRRTERSGVFAANCDRTGNIYTINSRLTDNLVPVIQDPLGSTYESIPDICITKNDETIFNISLDKQLKNGLSFIENETNWFFIGIHNFQKNSDARYDDEKGMIVRDEYQLGEGYLFTPEIDGEKIFTVSGTGIREFNNNSFMKIKDKSENLTSLIGLKLPIQGNYTMVVDEIISPPPYKIVNPEVAKITLYTPSDKKIFSDYIILGSNVTVYKDSVSRYLVGINARYFPSNIFLESSFLEQYKVPVIGVRTSVLDREGEYYPTVLNTGIYTFENGELIKSWLPEKEVSFSPPTGAYLNIDDVNPYVQFVNQKLQPMKKYKQWSEPIEYSN